MADVRDLIFANQSTAREGFSRLKFALRRIVVLTSFPPLSNLYAAIYRLHIWYAVRTLKRYPGLRAIYVTRGAISNELVYGVSDIDMFLIGEWAPGQQDRFMNGLRQLIRRSPLYDSSIVNNVNSIESLRSMYAADYFF